eukprot:scaffold114347_cov14-Tisochrysis_lutea.AAC.1
MQILDDKVQVAEEDHCGDAARNYPSACVWVDAWKGLPGACAGGSKVILSEEPCNLTQLPVRTERCDDRPEETASA